MIRTKTKSAILAAAVGLSLLSSCSEDSDTPDSSVADTGTRDAGTTGQDATVIADATTPDATVGTTIYERLGGQAGMQAAVGGFVGRVVADPKINGYFLNSSVNGSRLTTCLVKFMSVATGGPGSYPGTDQPADADGCRNMKAAHLGMGISAQDFNDLAGHLVDELESKGAAAADVSAIVTALGGLTGDIVERPQNTEAIYNRLGRKPAIDTVIGDFIARVVANPKINGYFLNNTLNADRLKTCLVRQVCGATGGPCKYGEETGPELFNNAVCAGMTPVHASLGISQADFDDLAADLVAALAAANVPQADIDAIVSVVAPLSSQIVTRPANNETIYNRIGRKPAIDLVVTNFIARVVANPKINGYFLNNTLNAARLKTCLVRQVCEATGGPCKYGLEAGPELFSGAVCQGMRAIHRDLGISQADFDDLAADLVAEIDAAGVPIKDRNAIVGVLGPMAADIVERPNDDETIYNRIGRKPAVAVVVADFAGRVLGDASLNGFFSTTNAERLGTCLIRQVCEATGGPCKYGLEAGPELFNSTPCRNMTDTHRLLRNPAGDLEGSPITKADFDTLVGHLVGAMTDAGVVEADRTTIVNVLAPMCPQIVAGGNGC